MIRLFIQFKKMMIFLLDIFKNHYGTNVKNFLNNLNKKEKEEVIDKLGQRMIGVLE